MDLRGRSVALYGRFRRRGGRAQLAEAVSQRGGRIVEPDQACSVLVVGAGGHALVDSGALEIRIEAAEAQGATVCGEASFRALLSGNVPPEPAYPLAQALSRSGLDESAARVLAALDLVSLVKGKCGFGDVALMVAAGEMLKAGHSLGHAVKTLSEAKALGSLGRRRLVILDSGEAALASDAGLTTLRGQGYLPLGSDAPTLEAVFAAAVQAEADGDWEEAARLYDLCARADRHDAVAPFNLGNIRLAEGRFEEAALAYQRALARDPRFLAARYNLAQALEALGRAGAAAVELERVLVAEPDYPDALFNLAQIELGRGDHGKARRLYELYLAGDPPADWAEKARRALLLCRSSA